MVAANLPPSQTETDPQYLMAPGRVGFAQTG